ncbi:MAG: uncharacterized protein KVP18_000681 [Porospora cf. gigantea A]|nr:MAG: hypothetical protein KVP18_000681 [Porospora cf. gigantea A]
MGDYYRADTLFGDGTFGRVLKCIDTRSGAPVAIKVIRDVERYNHAARTEIAILQKIGRLDPNRTCGIVRLLDSFVHLDRHVCLVTEPLGLSLYDFMTRNDYHGMYVNDVQEIAKHLLKTLKFMRSIGLTHTDLKPENVLFKYHDFMEVPVLRSTPDATKPRNTALRPVRRDVVVIDLGSATFREDHHAQVINTRQYRAPEVVLDVGWSEASDMWCVACILLELYTGMLYFRTRDHLEHLHQMTVACGALPQWMLRQAYKSGSGLVRRPLSGGYRLADHRAVRQDLLSEVIIDIHRPFREFIEFLLILDPDLRPTPEEALRHRFFSVFLEER